MEIEILENKKDSLEFIVKGERHTFSNILREALLQDSKIEFASYKLEHPFDNEVKFFVKTDGKTASKAISDALGLIETNLNDFEEAVKKAFKE